MADLERIRAAAREWLKFIGDIDNSPTVVPFGDPDGAEKKARYELGRVLRDELFEPTRHGPIYLWSSEGPMLGEYQHWGGSDIWRCDEHPDWQGEVYGSWERYRDYVASHPSEAMRRSEEQARKDWEAESREAHAAVQQVNPG
jgi:hypothetical protein